jgi:hypothetical protein
VETREHPHRSVIISRAEKLDNHTVKTTYRYEVA